MCVGIRTLILDPDYPLDPFYNPYKSLAIRAYFFPIETRLDHMQVTMKVLPDLAPKLLIVPQHYTVPIRFHDKTLTINYVRFKQFFLYFFLNFLIGVIDIFCLTLL